MYNSQSGFSLIEALISVLILTIGLLGLGQLQARLWSASTDLHTSTAAWLLANSLLEKSTIHQMIDEIVPETDEPEMSHPFAGFSVKLSVAQTESLMETEIQIDWSNRTGRHSVSMALINETRLHLSDTRWLLPPD